MPNGITGDKGKVTVGTDVFTWVGEFELTLKNNTTNIGPHIGDPNEYPLYTSQLWEWSLKGTVPSGLNIAQTTLRTAAANRTSPALDFYAFNGNQVTFAAATTVIEEWKTGLKADGTHTFEAKGKATAATLASGAGS